MNTQEFNRIIEKLSPRQKEVLERLLAGETYEAIAKSLGINHTSTVRKHISNIYASFFPDKKGRGRSADLVSLFIKHKPELLGHSTANAYSSTRLAIQPDPYIERPPIESICQQEIWTPGALLRIKAPSKMGKTLLLSRLINYAERKPSVEDKPFRAIDLKLRLAENKDFGNLDNFLKWFATSITQMLSSEGNSDKVSKFWNENEEEPNAYPKGVNSKLKLMAYFEDILLEKGKQPLVLGIDDLDRIFQYPDIAQDFLGLLRSLHEKAKTRPIWQNLRLILTHVQDYQLLNINSSPFNVGVPIELPEFTPEQVQELVEANKLNWQSVEINKLIAMVGGHPYLIQLALDSVSKQQMNLDKLLEAAPTEAGIYRQHLRQTLWVLQENSRVQVDASTKEDSSDTSKSAPRPTQLLLLEELKQIVNDPEPLALHSEEAWMLCELGLAKLKGNMVTPSCELYRQYFQDYFKVQGKLKNNQ